MIDNFSKNQGYTKLPGTSESEIATAILKIALTMTDGVVTFERAYEKVPDYINLTAHDESQSLTRPNEPMWHQIVRNIQSHWNMPGNFIDEGYLEHVPGVGYRITDVGRHYIAMH